MKNALVPLPGTHWKIRVFADNVEQGLEHADGKGLGILRHDEDMGPA